MSGHIQASLAFTFFVFPKRFVGNGQIIAAYTISAVQ
jgi:hypothetical protein